MKGVWTLAFALSLAAQTYKVQTAVGINDLAAEDYVAGVVAGESSVFRSDEALKAMAIAARTYAARTRGRHAAEGFDFCSTTHCQRYVSASDRSARAARDTAGKFLWFDGKPAFTPYSRNCGGKTENVAAVWPDVAAPYLVSHADPYCGYAWIWSGSPEQIRDALRQAGLKVPQQLRTISIVRRSTSGRAQMLSLDGELLSASAFRFAMGRSVGWSAVRSERYSIENASHRIVLRGTGEGHGVGLCQAGADQMGLAGKTYLEILQFYYPGVALLPANLHWTRLAGGNLVLYTMLPDSDRALMEPAERLIRRWPIHHSIDLYAYPDLESFRNATGEPGWVAARTTKTKIEMQPVAILRSRGALFSTLEHEIVHCFVESEAKPGLPVWFREGLVEYLTRHTLRASLATPNDAQLRQRQDKDVAQAAYKSAQARVQELVDRYGETAVVGWVAAGLPDDVKYSRASKPAVNSK